MQIKNQFIKIRHTHNGKVTEYTKENRIVNNFLDWLVYKNLPLVVGDVLFPKFDFIGAASGVNQTREFGLQSCFLKFDTPDVLNDNSTNMNYDLQSVDNNFFADIVESDSQSIEQERGYEFTVPLAQAGETLETIGFGISNFDFGGGQEYTPDYLFSFIQVGFFGLVFAEGDTIEVIRNDRGKTSNVSNAAVGAYYLVQFNGEMETLSFNGGVQSIVDKVYNIVDLNYVLNGVGDITISGFDPFEFEESGLFPAIDLFPATDLYPQSFDKFTNMTVNWNGISFPDWKTDLPLIDASISNDGGVTTINYSYERST